MTPFSRASIGLTMPVSRTVSHIFSVKEWRDPEVFVCGRSWALKMVPFGRPHDFLLVGYCKLYIYRIVAKKASNALYL